MHTSPIPEKISTGFPAGDNNIIENGSQHQREAGADGKRHRHAGHRDGGDDQNISHAENRSSGKCQQQTPWARGPQIQKEAIRR